MRFAALTLTIGFILAGTAAGATGRDGSASALPQPWRILYSSDWTGPTEIYAVDSSGKAPVGQLTFGREPDCASGGLFACGFISPMPSPNGRFVLYRSVAPYLDLGALWIARADGREPRLLTTTQGCAMWAPDSLHVAYRTGDGVHLINVDGSGEHVVAPPPRWWTDCSAQTSGRPARSPDGRWIAFAATDGIRVTDMRAPSAHFSRLLTHDHGFDLTWSPDSRSLAYIEGQFPGLDSISSRDLRVVGVDGRVRTVVAADHAYGGRIVSLAWTRPPKGTRYRTPEAAPAKLVTSDSDHADGLIERLAADGDHVAYVSCLRVHVWAPAQQTDVTVGGNPLVAATPPAFCDTDPGGRNFDYDLALAGDRVAYATRAGGLSYRWTMSASTLGSATSTVLATGTSSMGIDFPYGVAGMLAGSGPLLVYSYWHTPMSTANILDEEIRRVDADGCPCPVIASNAGPDVPLDVESGRIVAADDKATRVLDAQGGVLVTIPVAPLAAQLTGSDLVLLVRGRLLDYAASSGDLRQTWPLPDVPSGGETGDPNNGRAIPSGVRLALEDAAHGLVTYVLDEQVHVLRLADGKDATVGPGRLARFIAAGLVYADGARIRLIPFDRLPLS
jgi:Tol biopolymer transport system component